MKRINVIGSSGSGKSTFAKALAQKLDVTHIEMDKLFWKAGWQESTDHEFFSNLKNGPHAKRMGFGWKLFSNGKHKVARRRHDHLVGLFKNGDVLSSDQTCTHSYLHKARAVGRDW